MAMRCSNDNGGGDGIVEPISKHHRREDQQQEKQSRRGRGKEARVSHNTGGNIGGEGTDVSGGCQIIDLSCNSTWNDDPFIDSSKGVLDYQEAEIGVGVPFRGGKEREAATAGLVATTTTSDGRKKSSKKQTYDRCSNLTGVSYKGGKEVDLGRRRPAAPLTSISALFGSGAGGNQRNRAGNSTTMTMTTTTNAPSHSKRQPPRAGIKRPRSNTRAGQMTPAPLPPTASSSCIFSSSTSTTIPITAKAAARQRQEFETAKTRLPAPRVSVASSASSAFGTSVNGDDLGVVARASVVDFDSGREVREELGLREKKAAVENQLWPDKHRPRDITGLAVHVKKVDEVRHWMTMALAARPESGTYRLLGLVGPPGSAKSTMVRLLAQEMGLDLAEWQDTSGQGGPAYRPLADGPALGGGRPRHELGSSYQSSIDSFEEFMKRSSYRALPMLAGKPGITPYCRRQGIGDHNGVHVDGAIKGELGRRRDGTNTKSSSSKRGNSSSSSSKSSNISSKSGDNNNSINSSSSKSSSSSGTGTVTVTGGGSRSNFGGKGRPRMVLIEELPEMFGQEKKERLKRLMAECARSGPCPVILSWSQASESSSYQSQLEQVLSRETVRMPGVQITTCNPINATLLRKHLKGVLALEGVSDPRGALIESAIATCAGDIRHALLNLQMSVGGAGGHLNSARIITATAATTTAGRSISGKKYTSKTKGESSSSTTAGSRRMGSTHSSIGSSSKGGTATAGTGKRDTFLSSFHALGKLLYAKRSSPSPSSSKGGLAADDSKTVALLKGKCGGEGGVGEKRPRGQLGFVPEEVLARGGMELDSALAFLQCHCVDYFTDEDELSQGLAYFSDADLFASKMFDSSRGYDGEQGVFPRRYAESIASRATAVSNKHPAKSRMRAFGAPKSFEMRRNRLEASSSLRRFVEDAWDTSGGDVDALWSSSRHLKESVDTELLPTARLITGEWEADTALRSLLHRFVQNKQKNHQQTAQHRASISHDGAARASSSSSSSAAVEAAVEERALPAFGNITVPPPTWMRGCRSTPVVVAAAAAAADVARAVVEPKADDPTGEAGRKGQSDDDIQDF